MDKQILKQLKRKETKMFSTRVDSYLADEVRKVCQKNNISITKALEFGLREFLKKVS